MNTFKKQIIVEQKRIQRLIDLTDPPRPAGIITNLSGKSIRTTTLPPCSAPCRNPVDSYSARVRSTPGMKRSGSGQTLTISGTPPPFLDTENFAADGTRTRSKGETIFYNTFLDMGVLFRFDCVLVYVDQDGVEHLLYPDFLIKCFDGHLIAIEHLGWYGGLNYGIKFGKKFYYYLQQGFILGKNYFVTSDEKHGGTDSQAIQEIAQLVQKQFFGY